MANYLNIYIIKYMNIFDTLKKGTICKFLKCPHNDDRLVFYNEIKQKYLNYQIKTVPKILHFIWIGSIIPNKYIDNLKTYVDNNAEYKINLWVDRNYEFTINGVNIINIDSIDIINNHELNIVKNYGAKADILRLEIVYKYGGIYSDIDSKSLKAFDETFLKDSVTYIESGWNNLQNAFLCFSKENEFIRYCIECLPYSYKMYLQSKLDWFLFIGPTFLTTCFYYYNNTQISLIHQSQLIYTHYGYTVHTNDANWKKPKAKIITSKFDNKKFNIISLGSACCMVQNIHDNIYSNLGPLYRQPDNATNYFDWLITDFKFISYFFEKLMFKDDNFLSVDHFTFQDINANPKQLQGGWSNVYRKVEFKDKGIGSMISLHDVKKQNNKIPIEFIEKYKRRFDRLYNKIKNNDTIYFMHCFDFQWLEPYFPLVSEIQKIFESCKLINPTCKVTLYFFVHPKYRNNSIFNEYKFIDNVELCFLKDKGNNADWKANNLNFNEFLK